MTKRTIRRYLALGAVIIVLCFIPGAMMSTHAQDGYGATSSAAAAQANLTTALTAGPASQIVFAGDPTITIAFTNNLDSNVSSTVYAVVHNPSGQVVLMTASNLVAAAHTTQTVYLDVAGLLTGAYKVSIFAESNAVVISSETSVAVTIN